MIDNLRRLTLFFVAAFAVVGLTLAYWGIVRAGGLLARADNPRRVDDELAIQRGQILDRSGIPLAVSRPDEVGDFVRAYPHPTAAPVVGYYSLRYGVSGVEAAYDDVLRGDAFLTPLERLTNVWFHRSLAGGDVRVTIDVGLQGAVERALRGHRGAVVVLDVPSGEVLALASSPTYDPNQLDAQWEALREDPDAPLVNRVTQGLYQPGAALQTVLLGAGLNANLIQLDQTFEEETLTVEIGGATLECGMTPTARVLTLEDAYRWACPAPFQTAGFTLGQERLEGALVDFGLGIPTDLGLSPDTMADTQLPSEATLGELAVGQDDFAVTPLQMALVAAAVANHGEAPALRLVGAVRASDGEWQAVEPAGHPRAAISRGSAETVAGAMRAAVRSGSATAATVPDVPVSGHAGLAPSGGVQHAWFIGFAPSGEGAWLAVAVLVEDAEDASVAAEVGGEALEAALAVPE